MQFFNFTPQEIRALIFLLGALLVGSGITLYKRSHPGFAPELKVMKKDVDSRNPKLSRATQKPVKRKINLNKASASELELLPGLGPQLSRRIVQYRETRGKFRKIEDLLQVPGIGRRTLERIREYITVE